MDRIVEFDSVEHINIFQTIDWTIVNDILQREIEKSLKFLRNSLS
jgi:hypothetical protein